MLSEKLGVGMGVGVNKGVGVRVGTNVGDVTRVAVITGAGGLRVGVHVGEAVGQGEGDGGMLVAVGVPVSGVGSTDDTEGWILPVLVDAKGTVGNATTSDTSIVGFEEGLGMGLGVGEAGPEEAGSETVGSGEANTNAVGSRLSAQATKNTSRRKTAARISRVPPGLLDSDCVLFCLGFICLHKNC